MKQSSVFNWLWSKSLQMQLKKLWFALMLLLNSYQWSLAQTLDSSSLWYDSIIKPTITRSPLPDSLQDIGDQLLQSVLNQDPCVFEEHKGVNINTTLFLDSYSDDEGFKSRLALWDQHKIAKHILDLKLDAYTGEIYYSTSQNYESSSTISDEKIIEWYWILLKRTGLLVTSQNFHLSPKNTDPHKLPRKIMKI